MVCRRSDFEGQPVGEAQNPLGQTFTTQTEGNRVQGGGVLQAGIGIDTLYKRRGIYK